MKKNNPILNLAEDVFWFIDFGFKNLKIKILSLFNRNYSAPYRLLLKINYSCNYRCVMCENWKNSKKTFISKEKEEEIISNLKNKLFFLSITGGEPFLEEERLIRFVRKIKKANSKLKYISINTNCSRSTSVQNFATKILSEFPRLNIYLGLHYIPNKDWGIKETRIKEAHDNYKNTRRVAEKLENKFRKRFLFYNIVTVSKKEDFHSVIKKEKDLWLGFAIISSEFYNNTDNNYIEEISRKEKIKIIENFLKINKKEMSFLNKRFLSSYKKMLARGIRKRKCYAGINRVYVNPFGETFICSRGVDKRENMSEEKCENCWTSCEANFDLLPDFFLPSIFNHHYKDIYNK